MKQIKVGKRHALVDDEDYPLLSRHRWVLHKPNKENPKVYAALNWGRGGKSRFMSMHKLISGITRQRTDHIDGNGLNNQKRNLRPANASENGANQTLSSTNSSGFKGVSWSKAANKWAARIKHLQKCEYLGVFACKEEAARAYDAAAVKMFGRYAKTNKQMGLLAQI